MRRTTGSGRCGFDVTGEGMDGFGVGRRGVGAVAVCFYVSARGGAVVRVGVDYWREARLLMRQAAALDGSARQHPLQSISTYRYRRSSDGTTRLQKHFQIVTRKGQSAIRVPITVNHLIDYKASRKCNQLGTGSPATLTVVVFGRSLTPERLRFG